MEDVVFHAGDRVQYKARYNGEWYRATINGYCKEKKKYKVKLDGSKTLKFAEAAGLRNLYEKGEAVLYYSKSKLEWFHATVQSSTYHKDGTLKVLVDGEFKNAKNEQLKRGKLDQKEDKKAYSTKHLRYSPMSSEDFERKVQIPTIRPPLQAYTSLDSNDMQKSFPTSAPQMEKPKSAYAALHSTDMGAAGYDTFKSPTSKDYTKWKERQDRQPLDYSKWASQKQLSQYYDKWGLPKIKKNASAPSRIQTNSEKYLTSDSYSARVFCVKLSPNVDIVKSLQDLAKKFDIGAGFIMSCVGTTSKTTLQRVGASKPKVLEGKDFEILSMNGTFSRSDHRIHISVSNENYMTFGGQLSEGTVVLNSAELVIGLVDGVKFTREKDINTGFKELVVSEMS